MKHPLINIHTHDTREPGIFSIGNVRIRSAVPEKPTEGFFSAGIHPWDVHQAGADWLDILTQEDPHMIAVGETGLDHREAYAPYETQTAWFERQIGIANRLAKPLFVHCVHAVEACQRILAREAQVPVLIHGFTGSPETVRQWLAGHPDYYVSFGPYLLRSAKTQQALRMVFEAFPGQFFLETDGDPEITTPFLYQWVSEWLGTDPDALAGQIALNFQSLFPHISIEL